MWKEDLQRNKIWFDRYTERINEKVDEFYSTIPDSGLSDREQYLYDTAQNQFKMLYELLDYSKKLIDAELLMVGNAIETKQEAGTRI